MKTAMAKDPKDLPQEIPVRVPATTPQAFAHATPLQRQQSRDIKTAARDIADRLLAPMGSNEWADDRSDVMSVRIEMSERWNVDGALQQLAGVTGCLGSRDCVVCGRCDCPGGL